MTALLSYRVINYAGIEGKEPHNKSSIFSPFLQKALNWNLCRNSLTKPWLQWPMMTHGIEPSWKLQTNTNWRFNPRFSLLQQTVDTFVKLVFPPLDFHRWTTRLFCCMTTTNSWTKMCLWLELTSLLMSLTKWLQSKN